MESSRRHAIYSVEMFDTPQLRLHLADLDDVVDDAEGTEACIFSRPMRRRPTISVACGEYADFHRGAKTKNWKKNCTMTKFDWMMFDVHSRVAPRCQPCLGAVCTICRRWTCVLGHDFGGSMRHPNVLWRPLTKATLLPQRIISNHSHWKETGTGPVLDRVAERQRDPTNIVRMCFRELLLVWVDLDRSSIASRRPLLCYPIPPLLSDTSGFFCLFPPVVRGLQPQALTPTCLKTSLPSYLCDKRSSDPGMYAGIHYRSFSLALLALSDSRRIANSFYVPERPVYVVSGWFLVPF